MARKPTYEELEKRVKKLEKEAVERKQADEEVLLHAEIVENMAEGVYLIRTGDGVIVYANKTFERMFGYDPGELVNKHVSIVNAPSEKSPEEIANDIIQSLKEKGIWSGEVRNIKKDGTPFWCHANVSTFDHHDFGEVWVSVHQDISKRKKLGEELKKHLDHLEELVEERTVKLVEANEQMKQEIEERRRAEEALRESEQKYRTLAEDSIIGVHIHQDGKFVFVNDRFAQIHGYEREELLGKHYLTLIHPDHRKLVKQRASQRLKGKAVPQCYEVQKLRKDGETIWCEIMVTRIQYRGRPAIMGNTVDINERKLAEEALRESQERFREMADLLPTTISELDRDFNLTYVNQAAFETFGYSQADLEGGLNVLDMIHPDDRRKVRRNVKKVTGEGRPDRNEYRVLKKDGSELAMFVLSRPMYKDGSVVGIRSTLTDITERKMAEKELKENEKELEIKTSNLEEANAALKVLLKRRDEDKIELEEKVLSNVKELIFPYVEKLKNTGLDGRQMNLLSIIESNLDGIIAPFLHKLSSKYSNLTPMEIQVAGLVKEGKTTKEIAELMISSTDAIEFHRKNLRKKLGLKNTKSNLRSYLLFLP